MDYHSALFILLNIPAEASTALILLLIVLLMCSFVVSGAEVAFFSMNYKDINLLKTKQDEPYKKIVNLLEHPKILLGSMLIFNSLVNIAIIVISNILLNKYVHLPENLAWVEFLVNVVLVTCLLLLFCEVMPKVMANQNNIRFAKNVSPIIELVNYTFKGMSKWLVNFSDGVEKSFSNKTASIISNDEMSHAIDITYEEESEKNILKGILDFNTITVKEIMKGRLDVHGIEQETSFGNLLIQIQELHYSRLPVYKEELDQVVGIIHTKDVLQYINEKEDFNWHALIRPPFFVHEQKLIEDLLQEFQAKRIHFAVVVDEFGGTSGIVTLEDILEEVIGEIKDEFDEEESTHKKLDDYNYIFEGKTTINDVCKFMELPLDTFDAVKGESDTVAGLVLEVAGEIPKSGEIIACGDFDFRVLELIKHRINKVKVTIKPPEGGVVNEA